MNYQKFTLPNGLRVIVVPMPKMESATLTVWVKVGSRAEGDKVAGISHFLEHMVFKGGKKRPSAKAIAEAVDGIGGEFNAGTSKEWTNFYIKSRAQRLDTAFDVLSDMVLNPILKETDIQKEKGVILEEMAMYEDTPMYRIGDIFEQVMYQGHTLGRDIIGLPKSVKSISKNDFVLHRKSHYFTDNIVLTVAGGVAVKDVKKLADEYFGKLKKDKRRNSDSNKFKVSQKSPKVKLVEKKNEQAHLMLGFLGHPKGHPDRFTEAILATILGSGMSSRLFTEVREKRGLAYSVRTTTDHYTDTGNINTYAGVEIKKVDDAIKVILEQHYELASGKLPIKTTELKKAKEYIKGHMALALEDTKYINYFFGEDELLLGKVETPEEEMKKIDEVTVKDIVALAKKLFVPQKLNLAIIGPYNSQERFEKLLK